MNTKRRFDAFLFYDHTGIETHLEKMAAKGWELKKISNFGWQYRRMEPKKMHFTVTYYPQASPFDPVPSEGELTFQDFCAAAGWRLVTSSAQMQIFCNEQDNPVPIETDALLQVETIHKSARKSFLPGYIFLLLVGLLNGALFCTQLWGNPVGVLSNNANLFSSACWMLIIILALGEIIRYFRWYHKAKAAAELDGSFVETSASKRLQLLVSIPFMMIIGVACWQQSPGLGRTILIAVLLIVHIAALIILAHAIKTFLKRKRVSANVNQAVTTVVSFVLSFAFMGCLAFFVSQVVSKVE